MGAYINPPDQSKESWLLENARRIGVTEAEFHNDFISQLLVCLVDNGPFTAAAIMFDEREKTAWLGEPDDRIRRWFTAPKEKLLSVSNLAVYLNRRAPDPVVGADEESE